MQEEEAKKSRRNNKVLVSGINHESQTAKFPVVLFATVPAFDGTIREQPLATEVIPWVSEPQTSICVCEIIEHRLIKLPQRKKANSILPGLFKISHCHW